MICIYVAIGQKDSTVRTQVETLREYGALDYTIVVQRVLLNQRHYFILHLMQEWQWVKNSCTTVNMY